MKSILISCSTRLVPFDIPEVREQVLVVGEELHDFACDLGGLVLCLGPLLRGFDELESVL